jgi:hypothetical protein
MPLRESAHRIVLGGRESCPHGGAAIRSLEMTLASRMRG